MSHNNLTEKEREILALVIELSDHRQVAVTLNSGYTAVNKHIVNICKKLNLPSRYVKFGSLSIDEFFILKGIRSKRVERAMDRYGNYNAQDGAGRRHLVFYHTLVERCPTKKP